MNQRADPEWQRKYYARQELGLCTKCGTVLPSEYKYKKCDKCREKEKIWIQDNLEEVTQYRREYWRKYREEIDAAMHRVALAAQRLIGPQELTVQKPSMPERHKCLNCIWGTWCGDRFFCPLVGCVKKPTKQEEQNNADYVD